MKGFTYRAVIIAILLTLFLLASSSYIALKLGALPWPIIFSVVVCGGILRLISKKVNIHEVNVAQAGATIGGLVASGVVFTLPGIWYLESRGISIGWVNPWLVAMLVIAAGLLGVLLSVPLRKRFVVEEKLPYPSGAAGAEVLKAGVIGGRILFILVIAGLIAGIFALLRDLTFPGGFSVAALATIGIFLTLYPMPLAIGVGYILGKKASFSWFLGALFGWALLIPLLINYGESVDAAISMTQNLGMGLLLGSGAGYFFIKILPRLKQILAPFREGEWYVRASPLLSLAAVILLVLLGVNLIAAVIAVVLLYVVVAIAARMTGETNIDPLEQFGILVVVLIAFLFSIFGLKLAYLPAFLIAMFISVACAVAGDIGHDYKSAKIIGTNYREIIRIDLITVIVAGLAASFVLDIIRKGFSSVIFTAMMPAPQAKMVASSIFGFPHPYIFLIGFIIAFLIEALLRSPVMLMPLGIGLFLGFDIAIPLFIGGLIAWFISRKWEPLTYPFLIGAAGIMGGEGIAGFTAAAFTVFGFGSFHLIARVLISVFLVLLLILILLRLGRRFDASRN